MHLLSGLINEPASLQPTWGLLLTINEIVKTYFKNSK